MKGQTPQCNVFPKWIYISFGKSSIMAVKAVEVKLTKVNQNHKDSTSNYNEICKSMFGFSGREKSTHLTLLGDLLAHLVSLPRPSQYHCSPIRYHCLAHALSCCCHAPAQLLSPSQSWSNWILIILGHIWSFPIIWPTSSISSLLLQSLSTSISDHNWSCWYSWAIIRRI